MLWAHSVAEITYESPQERLRTLAALAISEGGHLLPDNNRLFPSLLLDDLLIDSNSNSNSHVQTNHDVEYTSESAGKQLNYIPEFGKFKSFSTQSSCMRCTMLDGGADKCVKKLKCSHTFHEECLQLTTNLFEQCPVCGVLSNEL